LAHSHYSVSGQNEGSTAHCTIHLKVVRKMQKQCNFIVQNHWAPQADFSSPGCAQHTLNTNY